MNNTDSTITNTKLIELQTDSTITNTKLIELQTNRKTFKKNKTKRSSIFVKQPPTPKELLQKKKKEKKQKLEMMYFLSDKIYGSTSWKKYVNETSPGLLKDLLDVAKYSQVVYQADTQGIDDLNNEQSRNLRISEMFTKAYCDLKTANQINGWNYRRTEIARDWDNELAYLYQVNYYMMFSLKRRESKWSWILIVFSSICSILTIITSDDEFLLKIVRYTLSFLAVCTSLIAAYIKKENYVDRIKELDRYTQKVGTINTEIDNVIKQKPWNRMPYSVFIDKYQRRINRLFTFLHSDKELIFIREEIGKLKLDKINKFINCIFKINPTIKFKLIIITNDKTEIKLDNVIFYHSDTKIIDWKRPELNWLEIFNL